MTTFNPRYRASDIPKTRTVRSKTGSGQHLTGGIRYLGNRIHQGGLALADPVTECVDCGQIMRTGQNVFAKCPDCIWKEGQKNE